MTSSTTTCTHPHDLITSIIHSLSTVTPTPQDHAHRSIYTTRTNPLTNLSQSEDSCLVRNVFMTLHFLFPHEVLPALDLLDRKLVTRLLITSTSSSSSSPLVQASSSSTTAASSSGRGGGGVVEIKKDGKKDADADAAPKAVINEVFFVQSASAATSTTTTTTSSSSSKSTRRHRRAYNPCNAHYEVRLPAWNCSCPAFAIAAFRNLTLSTKHNPHGPANSLRDKDDDDDDDDDDDYSRPNINPKAIGTPRDWRFGGTLTRPGAGAPVCKHLLAAVLGREAPNLFGQGVMTREVSREEGAGWVGGWGD